MKALAIHVNGVEKCVAGTEGDTLVATVSGGADADGSYFLAVFGKTPQDEQTAFWLAEPLFIQAQGVDTRRSTH